MKTIGVMAWLVVLTQITSAQNRVDEQKSLAVLIDDYSRARESRDTILLKEILTPDVDQLVSTGEWRSGIQSATRGMMNSSAANPGTRTLTVDRIKFLSKQVALIDCKYEIKNPDGSVRKMWSSFITVKKGNKWKITSIRNMLPAPQ